MDTTEQYKKMCEKAFKDIGLTEDGGVFIMKPLEPPLQWPGSGLLLGTSPGSTPIIGQLYQQDQLQKMIGGYGLLGGEVQLIWEYMRSFRGKEGWRPETWEQLWLGLVMKEFHNKAWSMELDEWEFVPKEEDCHDI